MAGDVHGLMLKADGLIDTIKGISEAERREQPSHAFGEDYNTLRRMVLEALPNVKEMMPPAVSFNINRDGGPCIERYVEILTWTQQLSNFLHRENRAQLNAAFRRGPPPTRFTRGL